MSDISDLENVLANEVTNIVYPQMRFDAGGAAWDKTGVYDTPASTAPDATGKSPSVSGTPIVVYPGWPSSDNLAKALAAGVTHITVFPQAMERNTTRYQERELIVMPPAPTLTLAISKDLGSVTVGGTVSAPQNLALRVNNKFYTYAVNTGDTLNSISAALAAALAVDVSGTSAMGPVITLGPSGRLQAARVGGFATIAREVKRQERVMSIITWANSAQLRDQIAGAVDASLADTRFLDMPDGFGARLIYKNSMVIDAQQKAGLYRRDLNYTVEYATTISKQRAAVIAPTNNLNAEFAITY